MRLVEGYADVDDVAAFLDDLNGLAATHDVTIQAFDARYVVGRGHLERAVELADRAIERGENVARERGVEILLYAAGRRQIDDALEMGMSEDRTPVVVVVSGDDEATERAAAAAVDDLLDSGSTLGAIDPEGVRAFFDVTEAELAAVDGDLSDLIAERVALLDVEK